eukprot:gene5384-6717_t
MQVNRVLDVLQKDAVDMSSLKDRKTLSRIKLAQAMKQFLGIQSKHQKQNQRVNFKTIEERWPNDGVANSIPPNKLLPTPTSGHLLTDQNLRKRVQPISMSDADEMQQQRIDSRVYQEVTDEEFEQQQQQYKTKLDQELLESESTESIAGLDYRLKNVSLQSAKLGQSQPQHRHLLIRCSKRCRRCDRLLVKPDINPGKTEFKRQHFAFSYVPRIQISRAVWVGQDVFDLYLVITNPLHSHLFISFPSETKNISFQSVDDNAQPIDWSNETYISGLLDETDDIEKESILQQLKEKENPRYIINRKDNKLTLKFMVKVGLLNQDNDQEILEIKQQIDTTTSSSIISTNNISELPKFKSQFQNLKFTILLEYSSSISNKSESSTTTTTSTSTNEEGGESSSEQQSKNILKLLFNIPSTNFENTLIE